MKLLFILITVILSVSSFAQTKYLIYFKDKGIDNSMRLEKTSSFYKSAINELTDRCIERRIKNLGEDNIISYEDVPLRTDYVSNIEAVGIQIKNKLKWFNAVSAYLTQDQVKQILQLSFVEKIEPVRILKFKSEQPDITGTLQKQMSVNTPFDYGASYNQLQLSEIPIVHSSGITGEGVLIGVLDSGFDWKEHEALQNAGVIAEYDFVNHDSVTSDEEEDLQGQQNHGTLIFSIIGGFKNGSLIGASFGSDFILAKTEDEKSETHIEEDNYAAALEWMENYGVDITSSSIGYNEFDSGYSYTYADMDGKTTIVTRAAELAFSKGVLTITSAGNEGNTAWRHIIAPADGFNTLGIGAVDGNNVVENFSSRGPTYDGRIKPDAVAKGISVLGAQAGTFDYYTFDRGTSVAAPIACGIAALLLSAHSHLNNTQLRSILLETAHNSANPNNERGYGLLSALRAVEFPNLEYSDNSYTLHKIILGQSNFNPQTVSLQYFTNETSPDSVTMDFNGDKTFTYKFPDLLNGVVVEFHITYSDSLNNTYREPETGDYKFIYGQLNISSNLESNIKLADYTISQVYPNPFIPGQHLSATLAVNSSGGEQLRIAIIDASGQQVKLYETVTTEGENYFNWNGVSDRGIQCASGVYFYLVRMGTRNYGRKMILMK